MDDSKGKIFVQTGLKRRLVHGLNLDYLYFEVSASDFMEEITKVFPNDNRLQHNIWTSIRWLLNYQKVMLVTNLIPPQKMIDVVELGSVKYKVLDIQIIKVKKKKNNTKNMDGVKNKKNIKNNNNNENIKIHGCKIRFQKFNDPWKKRNIFAMKNQTHSKMIVFLDLLECMWKYEAMYLQRFTQKITISSLDTVHGWFDQRHLNYHFYKPNLGLLEFFLQLSKFKVKINAAHQLMAMIVIYSFYPSMLYHWIVKKNDWEKKDALYWQQLSNMVKNWEASSFVEIPSPWHSYIYDNLFLYMYWI